MNCPSLVLLPGAAQMRSDRFWGKRPAVVSRVSRSFKALCASGGFHKWGVPKNGLFISLKIPSRNRWWLGGPPFMEPPISGFENHPTWYLPFWGRTRLREWLLSTEDDRERTVDAQPSGRRQNYGANYRNMRWFTKTQQSNMVKHGETWSNMVRVIQSDRNCWRCSKFVKLNQSK